MTSKKQATSSSCSIGLMDSNHWKGSGPGQWKWNGMEKCPNLELCLVLEPWGLSWGIGNLIPKLTTMPTVFRGKTASNLSTIWPSSKLWVWSILVFPPTTPGNKYRMTSRPTATLHCGRVAPQVPGVLGPNQLVVWQPANDCVRKKDENNDCKFYRKTSISHTTSTKVPKYWSCEENENSRDHFYRQTFLEWKLWHYCQKSKCKNAIE